MKKLLTFASVIALAMAFAVDGTAAPGGNPGPPGGGGGGPPGDPSPTVSEFGSPFVALTSCDTNDDNCMATAAVPGSSGTINSLGVWDVQTAGLDNTKTHAICLYAVSAPVSLPFRLATLSAGELDASGTIDANPGDWVGLSFQIRSAGDNCSGTLLQESGLDLGSDGASRFSSPFVVPNCGPDTCEVADSYGLINNDSDWVVLTDGLSRGDEYQVCVDAFIAPASVTTLPFRLATRSAQKRGTFFASGNMLDKYDFVAGFWVGLSLQIYVHGLTGSCEGGVVQETGITIVVD